MGRRLYDEVLTRRPAGVASPGGVGLLGLEAAQLGLELRLGLREGLHPHQLGVGLRDAFGEAGAVGPGEQLGKRDPGG